MATATGLTAPLHFPDISLMEGSTVPRCLWAQRSHHLSPFQHPSLTPHLVHLLLADTPIYETPNSSPTIYRRQGDVSAHSTLLQSLPAARRGFFFRGGGVRDLQAIARQHNAALPLEGPPRRPTANPASQVGFTSLHGTILAMLTPLRCFSFCCDAPTLLKAPLLQSESSENIPALPARAASQASCWAGTQNLLISIC